MLAEGVAMAPGAYEAVFVGLAHTDAVIDQIAEAAHRAATTSSPPPTIRLGAAGRTQSGGLGSGTRPGLDVSR